jgi:hypothetical protein
MSNGSLAEEVDKIKEMWSRHCSYEGEGEWKHVGEVADALKDAYTGSLEESFHHDHAERVKHYNRLHALSMKRTERTDASVEPEHLVIAVHFKEFLAFRNFLVTECNSLTMVPPCAPRAHTEMQPGRQPDPADLFNFDVESDCDDPIPVKSVAKSAGNGSASASASAAAPQKALEAKSATATCAKLDRSIEEQKKKFEQLRNECDALKANIAMKKRKLTLVKALQDEGKASPPYVPSRPEEASASASSSSAASLLPPSPPEFTLSASAAAGPMPALTKVSRKNRMPEQSEGPKAKRVRFSEQTKH